MGQGNPSRPNSPLTRTMLGQLCASCFSRSRPGCDTACDRTRVCRDAVDQCATREAPMCII
jgi:hypothetical protein